MCPRDAEETKAGCAETVGSVAIRAAGGCIYFSAHQAKAKGLLQGRGCAGAVHDASGENTTALDGTSTDARPHQTAHCVNGRRRKTCGPEARGDDASPTMTARDEAGRDPVPRRGPKRLRQFPNRERD